MRTLTIVLTIWTAALVQLPAYAQDWADDLTNAPRVLAPTLVPANPKHLTMTEARALIENTLQLQDNPVVHYVDNPNFYCIINLVNWKTTSVATDSSAWFVFRGGTHWNAVNLEAARVDGSRKVAVLYLHLVQAVTDPVSSDYDTFAAGTGNIDIAAMKTAYAQGRLAQFQDASGRSLTRVDGITYVTGYPPTVPLDYRIEVTRKTIAPFGHLLTLLGAAAQAGGSAMKLANRTAAIWAGQYYDTQYSTSDILVKAQMGIDQKELDKKTFDNEGYYYFDFSAGIPLRGIKQLQYNSTNGTATPQSVTTTNAYGLVNMFVKPVDVKTDYTVWPPSFVAGVGLTGHPLDKPLVGLGFGYGKISGFVGCVFNNVSQPGATLGSTISHHEEKFVFGINLTARQLADLLKKK